MTKNLARSLWPLVLAWSVFVTMPIAVAAQDSPAAIVDRFIQAFNDKDLETIESLLADGVVYHNLPMEPVSGKQAVMQAIRSYAEPSETIEWKVLHQAVSGDVVLNERVDRFVIGGTEIVLPVMGTFEVRDGQISAWRDYFDLATWQRQAGN